MTSYLNGPGSDELFPSSQNVRARQAVQRTVRGASPDLIAAEVNRAERAGAPLASPIVQQTIAKLVAIEHRQEQAKADAGWESQVRRYSMPPAPKGKQ